MDIKDLTIRQLAARIANDSISMATLQAQLEIMKNEKEVAEQQNGGGENGE